MVNIDEIQIPEVGIPMNEQEMMEFQARMTIASQDESFHQDPLEKLAGVIKAVLPQGVNLIEIKFMVYAYIKEEGLWIAVRETEVFWPDDRLQGIVARDVDDDPNVSAIVMRMLEPVEAKVAPAMDECDFIFVSPGDERVAFLHQTGEVFFSTFDELDEMAEEMGYKKDDE